MGKASRNKGQRGEREVAKLLSEWSGEKIERKLGAAREGGSDIEVWGYSIEVKRAERFRLSKWWEQACEQAEKEGNQPLLVYRRNNEPWECLLVAALKDDPEPRAYMLYFKDWFDLFYPMYLANSNPEVDKGNNDSQVSY